MPAPTQRQRWPSKKYHLAAWEFMRDELKIPEGWVDGIFNATFDTLIEGYNLGLDTETVVSFMVEQFIDEWVRVPRSNPNTRH
jgi:hypothetical protein